MKETDTSNCATMLSILNRHHHVVLAENGLSSEDVPKRQQRLQPKSNEAPSFTGRVFYYLSHLSPLDLTVRET
jgi:hypothetical protein